MRYQKTELGRQTFKERNLALSQRQRSAFILFDGTKDDDAILRALAPTGFNQEDIEFLVQSGLIEPMVGQAAVVGVTAGASAGVNSTKTSQSQAEFAESSMSEQDRYKQAYSIAVKLTSGLGFRGFRLNMSVESAGSYQELLTLAPKIREAVGDDKFAELQRALKGL
jgi:hypothetical protein